MTKPTHHPKQARGPQIKWMLCRDKQPPIDSGHTYLVTVGSPHTGRVWTSEGKYESAERPEYCWLVSGDEGWESPRLYNCQVIAWSLMPRPYTGKKP
jgi:hypothetical protein